MDVKISYALPRARGALLMSTRKTVFSMCIFIRENPENLSLPGKVRALLFFITSDKLGAGDDQLGAALIRAFINTLCNASTRPAKLLFINDGVKLTTEGSPVLDDLQLLAIGGVEIFSCGTCLDYYKLKDKLKVGLVTNMYDTVDSLLSAGKIIKI